MSLTDHFAESMLQVDRDFLSRIAKTYPKQGSADPTHRADTVHDSAPGLETIRFPGPPSDIGSLGRIDSMHIISKIGSGGFGEVYLAFDEKFSREVAVKILRVSSRDADYLARFKREAQAAGSIRHENVVMHLGMLEPTAHFPYACLVLEYVSGGSLKELIKAEQPYEIDQAVRWMIQAAQGLAAVHSKGVIHRDVKPGNLLIGEGGKIKLSDFGLARVTSSEGDVSVHVAGTPPYMSPEQIQTPDQLTFQTDIYSLGVVLYEVLTGSRPFRGNDVALRRQIVNDQPTPLRQLNPQVPLNLETICLRALHKEPSRRFESAKDFADDLQRWLDGRPVSSRPISRVEKAYMWARRSPELASLCLLMFVTAAISLGAAIWISQLRESETQARRAADLNALETTKHQNIALNTMQMMVTDLGQRIGTHDALIALYPKVNEQLEEMNLGKTATPERQHTLAISNLQTAHIYSAFTTVIQSPETVEKAKQHFERAVMLLKTLPGDYRHDLIKAYDGLGSYSLRVGNFDVAQASFQSALKIAEKMLQEHPKDTAVARDISVFNESLGKIKVDLGKQQEGLDHYRASLVTRERLTSTDQTNLQSKSDLGSVLINYGIAIRASESTTASRFFDRAVALYAELVDNEPLNIKYMRGLALGYDQQGQGLESAERMPYVKKALDIREKARRINPMDRDNLNSLIVSYLEVAQHTDDPVTSKHNYDLALELATYWTQKDGRDLQPLKFIARVNLGFCTMQRNSMKFDDAKNFATEAINIRKKIVALSPTAFNITSLVVALKELADIEQQLGEFGLAIKNLDEALERLNDLKEAQQLLPQNEDWIPELVTQREDILSSSDGIGRTNAPTESIQ